MGCDDRNGDPSGFKVRTVRGEPYEVGGRKLTPVTRMISFGKARATIRRERYGGWAGGLAVALPVALLEETGEGEQEIAIYDATFAILRRLGLLALGTTFFFATIRWWARRRRRSHSD